MPRDLDAALHITPMRPAWSAFGMYGRHVTHLIVAQAPGSLITLCGLHLPVKRRALEELLPAAVRCHACEERLQPGSPLLLTPETFNRVATRQLEQQPGLFDEEQHAVIRKFIKLTIQRWQKLTRNPKGDMQA